MVDSLQKDKGPKASQDDLKLTAPPFDPAFLLDEMPDYSSEETLEVAKHIGPFLYDLEEEKFG